MKGIIVNIFLIVFLILAPLLVGFYIYIIYRDANIYLYYIFNKDVVKNISLFKNMSAFSIPNYFIYSLSDGLWVFIGTNIFLLIWKDNILKHFYWIALSFLIGLLYEYFQYIGLIRGTFDIFDIASMFISFFVSLSAYYFWMKI